ncbi:MAG: tRNA (adenosine(37)-N6)-dimethylallyltransferase MiaA [Planctomycetaceae bacterium]
MKFEPALLQKCWFLAGPTACGKTDTGLLLAERLGAEIIGLDSMSLYRGMDLGTAKPTVEERSRVPHHLIDVLDPHEEFTVADYVEQSKAVCREILDRGKVPLFVGGTGLYLRGLLRGVFAAPPADWQLRGQLEERAQQEGHEVLHRELQAVDPPTAARLHPNDVRRVVRALEVFYLTGTPASQQQREQPLPIEQRPRHVYWLSPPRDWLYERINRRVVSMIEAGWVDEVRTLLERDQGLSRTARQALGYQELIAYLNGECSLEGAIQFIQTRTRQFAKRQHTWFRNLEECQPIEITGNETAEEVASQLLARDSA